MEEKERLTLISSCPICGRTLFRGTLDSHIEGVCPKCMEYLSITYEPQGVQVVIQKKERKTEKKQNR